MFMKQSPGFSAAPAWLRGAHISKIGTQKDFSFTSDFKGTAWFRQWEGWCNSMSNGGFPRAGCDEKKAVLL